MTHFEDKKESHTVTISEIMGRYETISNSLMFVMSQLKRKCSLKPPPAKQNLTTNKNNSRIDEMSLFVWYLSLINVVEGVEEKVPR